MADGERITGEILRVIRDRGFGFCSRPNDSDVFLHAKELRGVPFDDLLTGRRITFLVAPGTDGRERAVDARLVE